MTARSVRLPGRVNLPDMGTGLQSLDGFDIELLGLGDEGFADYHQTWAHQRAVLQQVAGEQVAPRLIFVQHPSVYTAGRATLPSERPFDGTPVVDVDRGGRITWHGPGQLVCYPIVKLPGRVGVVDYVRRVEQAVIDYLSGLGVDAGRTAGQTGVWLPATSSRSRRKICAIGVRVARRTTMHGLALNVMNTTDRFANIVPCGIADAEVTSIVDELAGPAPGLHEVIDGLSPHLIRLLDFDRQTSTEPLAEGMPA